MEMLTVLESEINIFLKDAKIQEGVGGGARSQAVSKGGVSVHRTYYDGDKNARVVVYEGGRMILSSWDEGLNNEDLQAKVLKIIKEASEAKK